jgi:hypothetical protein
VFLDASRCAAVLQERVRQRMETAAKKDVFLGDSVELGELMEVFSLESGRRRARGHRNQRVE